MAAVNVPDSIRTVFDQYGFDALKLSDAVATRSAPEWFAILFPDPNDAGSLTAVDFRLGAEGWEVQNDSVGPFDSIRDFKREKLTHSFI